MFPIAYAYPKEKRAVRDLLRRRLFFVRQRAELSVHLQNTNHHTSLRAVCMRRNYLSRRFRGLHITEAYTAGLLKNEDYMRLRPGYCLLFMQVDFFINYNVVIFTGCRVYPNFCIIVERVLYFTLSAFPLRKF